jgi:hypothetical protein
MTVVSIAPATDVDPPIVVHHPGGPRWRLTPDEALALADRLRDAVKNYTEAAAAAAKPAAARAS